MTEKDRDREGKGDIAMESWTRASLDFWETSANMWFGAMKNVLSQPMPPGSGGKAGTEGARDEMPGEDLRKAFDQFWRTYFQSFQKTDGDQAAGPAGFLPEGIFKIFEPVLNQFAALWQPPAVQGGKSLEGFSEFMEETSRSWFGTYEEELRKYLNMPQLGLTRYYQERLNRTIDRFQVLRSRMMDFAHLFYKPLEESLLLIEEEMRLAEGKEEALLKDPRAWYQAWISKLERKYLEMLRSEDYIETLRNTLNALYDYRKVRQQFLIDLLQDLPIPTNREMDEVYKDLYLIKKRLTKLEKRGIGHEDK